MMILTKIPTVPNFSGLFRYQAPCPEVAKYSMSRVKAFSSTFEENPKFLFFRSPNLFVYKLTFFSRASSTIFKYLQSWRWCLLKISSLSVLLYLDNLIPRRYCFKSRTCAKILIMYKNRFQYRTRKEKKRWLKGCACG